MRKNLADLHSYDTDGNPIPLTSINAVSESAHVRSYFTSIKTRLIEHIEEAEIVVGCVAWLTDFDVLRALSQKKHASLVVQKEDFLRPDIDEADDFRPRLREAYDRIKGFMHWHGDMLPSRITTIGAYPIGWEGQGVRCAGYRREPGHPAQPTMHHKFLVFCRTEDDPTASHTYLAPYAAWTGSYNFTRNATLSKENALYISDRRIANSYFNEWAMLLSASEELDWTSEWIAPDASAFVT